MITADACNAPGGAGPYGEEILCERPARHAGAHARNVTVTWESCPVCKDKPHTGFQCTRCGRTGVVAAGGYDPHPCDCGSYVCTRHAPQPDLEPLPGESEEPSPGMTEAMSAAPAEYAHDDEPQPGGTTMNAHIGQDHSDLTQSESYWETRCHYCEAPLRRDGGCSMWHGEPHDLPYRERRTVTA